MAIIIGFKKCSKSCTFKNAQDEHKVTTCACVLLKFNDLGAFMKYKRAINIGKGILMVTISLVFALFIPLHMKVQESKCAQYVHLAILVRYDDSMVYATKNYTGTWQKRERQY